MRNIGLFGSIPHVGLGLPVAESCLSRKNKYGAIDPIKLSFTPRKNSSVW